MTTDELIEIIKNLSDEDREKVLDSFCRCCHVYLGDERDWSDTNYCYQCSPDPRE